MEKRYDLPFQKFMLSIFLVLFSGILTFSAQAQQTDHPFSIELNAGGGLIGNSTTNTAFQPEIGINYMPGSWGVGLNAGLYSFGSGFSADQYRTGYEQYTLAEQNSDDWNAISINVGPRFQKSLSRFISLNMGLDLAMNYQEGPSQSVRFNDPSGELESSGVDTDIVLAQMDGEGAAGWNTAIRPQLQLEFQPGFSDRFSFNVKTGIQHHLSDREITYTERDLSRVRQVDSPFEMHHQFENAPVVQRTESAPKTNFFANAGIKIRFGGSRAPAAAPNQDYNSSRSNKPGGSIANDGGGDCDDGDPRCTPGSSRAQDYNAARSNKPTSEAAPDDVVVVKDEGLTAADNFVDEIIEVLDRCDNGVCEQVRVNADGRKDTFQRVREGELSQDEGIEQVHSIVMEDVASLDKCETDVCRDILRKDVQLLEHMNVLMSLVQSGRAAEAQDYNSSRSNKPSSIADGVGDGDLDSDDDSVEMAQDYNSSRSNKPSSIAADDEREGPGLQVVYITKDNDGKVYAWGQRPEARSQDGSGKLYSWGRVPESLATDGDGRVYAWGDNSRASTRNGDGLVYSWGVAERAGALDDEGKIYAWGVRPQVEGEAAAQRGIDKKDIRRGMVTDPGPGQLGNALYLAKELGLTSVGDDIENIMQVLDRCDDGVCEQVRLNADKRHEGVRRALENPSGMDSDIEEIRSIVMEDIESLGRCDTDVCREVLAMEEDLLVKMNRLSDMEQVAPAQDYNSSRSNKYSSRAADVGDGDLDSDDDGIDDAIETAQDYNSSRSNKPSSIADGVGDADPDSDNDGIIREASRMARLINPSAQIISAGPVMMTPHPDSPIYEGDAVGGENALARTEANDSSEDDFQSAGINSPIYEMADAGGDGDGDNNTDPFPSQRYNMQPNSYCVSLSGTSDQVLKTFFQTGDKPSSLAQDTGEGDPDSDDDGVVDSVETAQDYNSSRSNKYSSIADIGDLDSDGFPDFMKSASFSISKRSARTGRSQSPIHEGDTKSQSSPLYESRDNLAHNGGDMDADAEGFHLELEINDMRSSVSEVISRMDSETPTTRADSSANAPPGAQVAPSQTKVIVLGVTDNGDIIPLEESKLIEFEFNGDPDSDDDGLMDSMESATFSISKSSTGDDDPCGPGVWARTTGGSENCSPENSNQENPLSQESVWNETPVLETAPPSDVYQWTYKLSALTADGDLPGDGTLTVLFTGGNLHFNVHIDPDDDGDGFGDLLQNSSFSISKRSARTGRNP